MKSVLDHSALELMIRKYIINLLLKTPRAGHQHDINDLVQDTLLAAYEKDNFDERYLMGIAKKVVAQDIRKTTKYRPKARGTLDIGYRQDYPSRRKQSDIRGVWRGGDVAEEPMGPDLGKQEALVFLKKYMEKLPKLYRKILDLRFFKHMKFKDIAAQLDMNISQVKPIVTRARYKLKLHLEPYYGENFKEWLEYEEIKEYVTISEVGDGLMRHPEMQAAIAGVTKKALTSDDWEIALDAIQGAGDLLGFDPTVGTAADAANAAVYGVRAVLDKEKRGSHIKNAVISLLSMVPFGDVVKALRVRKLAKTAKFAAKVARPTRTAARNLKMQRAMTNLA